jgi:small multidrug resistance family-3 protein
MLRTPQSLQAIAFLIAATSFEVSGDAVVRIALHSTPGLTAIRILLFVLGAGLLFAYGSFLNLAPLEFREVVGLYIATLFIMWQIINFVFFWTLPTVPVLAGGALIVTGGAIVTFWKT